MSDKNHHISLKTQFTTLYLGIFIISVLSYIIISNNYQKINTLKDQINNIESIKFNLYELNFDINNSEISRNKIKNQVDLLELQFKKLIDKNSPIYNPSLTDSVSLENLRIQLADNEQKIYSIYKNWRSLSYLIEKSFLTYKSGNKINKPSKDLFFIQKEISVLRQFISKKLFNIRDLYIDQYKESKNDFKSLFVLVTTVNISYIIFMVYFSRKIFSQPLLQILSLSKDLTEHKENIEFKKFKNKEYSSIRNSFKMLWEEQKLATQEIKKITNGDIEIIEENLETIKSPLKKAIVQMKKNLHQLNREEEKRKWIVQGQALINETLNRNFNNFDSLTNELTNKLVKYTNSLQGGLFIVKKDDKNQKAQYLELTTSYAYDRTVHNKNKIYYGEGLLGQVWKENKGLYIENIPNDHMNIKSFVGKSKPSSLLIEPLSENNEFYGIIELASLQKYKEHEIELIKKIAINIASAIAAVENNNRTKLLLEESRSMTEKLQKQEELTQSNLSKLTSTQEEVKRREIQKEKELKAFTEQFKDDFSEQQKIIISKDVEINHLVKQLSSTETDNDTIRQLKKDFDTLKEAHKKEIQDLEETIKIKEMRVLKFKKRLDKLSTNES